MKIEMLGSSPGQGNFWTNKHQWQWFMWQMHSWPIGKHACHTSWTDCIRHHEKNYNCHWDSKWGPLSFDLLTTGWNKASMAIRHVILSSRTFIDEQMWLAIEVSHRQNGSKTLSQLASEPRRHRCRRRWHWVHHPRWPHEPDRILLAKKQRRAYRDKILHR